MVQDKLLYVICTLSFVTGNAGFQEPMLPIVSVNRSQSWIRLTLCLQSMKQTSSKGGLLIQQLSARPNTPYHHSTTYIIVTSIPDHET